MIRKLSVFIFLSVLNMGLLHAQFKPSIALSGYVSNMQSVMLEDIEEPWISDNLFHNRLNFSASLLPGLDVSLEMRNRLMYGETIKYTPGYSDLLDTDRGWIDLSWNVATGNSFVFNTAIDRLYLDYTLGNFQATYGRQRINWGMNFVWNPNDIFNSYSFFDFDYIERPGSDAIRLQYYVTSTSSVEAVAKNNDHDEWSAAGLVRINLLGADLQILSGLLDEKEWVVGAGISRYIGPVSISGEVTYLEPKSDQSGLEPALIGGMAMNYNTPFNLFIQCEYLYNEAAENMSLNNFSDFYYRNLTIRDLSFAPHTWFTNLSWPLTPLLNIGVSGMYFPKMKGIFLGPSLDYSLRDDIDLSIIVQHFQMTDKQPYQKMSLGFLRLKWSF